MTILAIDQGTTSTRALLVEKSGASKIIKTLEHQQYYPKPGWVEHNPEELIHNIQACLDCSEKYISIGIDNQGESCLAWDTETKQAITPVIVWQDNRTHQTIDRLQLENSQDLATKFGVQGIPTILVLKNGKEMTRIVGFNPDLLKEKIKGAL